MIGGIGEAVHFWKHRKGHCPHCGRLISISSEKCEGCGSALTRADRDKFKKTINLQLAVSGVIFITIFTILVVFFAT